MRTGPRSSTSAGVERALGGTDRFEEPGPARLRALQVVASSLDPRFQLTGGLFEALDFTAERARALDKRRVRCLGLGGTLRLCLHSLAGLEQAALGGVEEIVGGALLGLNARNRLPCLVVPGFLHAQLFLG